jgi:hypothetical protein
MAGNDQGGEVMAQLNERISDCMPTVEGLYE